MKIIELDGHPLLGNALTILRNKKSSGGEFRNAANIVSKFLAIETARDILPVREVKIETLVGQTTGTVIDDSKKIILVPILRSGLAMLPMLQEVIPNYDIGFVGQKRDEATAEPKEYYCNIPVNHGSPDVYRVVILDPMIATGGSAAATIKLLVEKYKIPQEIIYLVAIVAAPEGLELLSETFSQVTVLIAARDERLNAKKFIVPGFGDFGDRFFGSEKPKEVI
ncbi:uracil phosphoribosyltransferase [Patescibacteria group bacterium]|nr:uracil phosphoribosyltransferase [Patescibacteria group bacterium]MBU4056550.1 uracil phosphoribosyltransferase [Patescibacteria group bacterium]